MLLTIDVGNTNITIAVMKDNDVLASYRLTTDSTRTSDELGISLITLLSFKGIDYKDIKGAIISSVVPKIMYSLNNAVIKYFNTKPVIVGPGIKTGIKLKAENPKSVGADRIVNVVAAYEKYKCACLVIDFGTATTFDFINDDAEFEYTVITPGIEISANALWSKAAKLPEIEIKKPDSILAKNTVSGMQAGIVYGYIGQVEYIIKKMQEELKTPFKVIATGGLGRVVFPHTDYIDTYEKDLTFLGLQILYQKNKDL